MTRPPIPAAECTAIRLAKCAAVLTGVVLVAACATPTPQNPAPPGQAQSPAQAQAQANLPQSSAECLAANLQPAEPFLASAIPDDILRRRQNGWVAMRYDVAGGKAQNVVVAASSPPGLYDAYALQHAARYKDSRGLSVRGCVMTIDLKF